MFERLSATLAVHNGSIRDLRRLPNLLSLSRFLLAGLFPLTLGHAWWSFTALAVAAVTDIIDGWWARRTHQETALGAVIDALADKVLVLCVVLTLLASGRLSFGGLLLLGTRDLGELALAFRLYIAGRPVFGRSANVGGKIATVLQYAALVAVVFHSSHVALFIGAAAVGGVMATIAYWQRDAAA
jgi:phosphatidylglycerophosphate synthase